MKKVLVFMLIAFIAISCKKDDIIEVQSVVLNENKITLKVEEQHQLVAKFSPEDANDNKVAWSSSDDKVVTVSEGLITAVASGKAVVIAHVGSKSASCEVVVDPDIYAVGGQFVDESLEGPAYAMMWKNGKGTKLTDGVNYAAAYCIHIDNKDIYIGGVEMDAPINGYTHARIWKNGQVIFSADRPSNVSDLVVENGTLYAVGSLNDENDITIPVLWKNSVPQILDTEGHGYGVATKIKIIGNDIYVGGSVMSPGEYNGWKVLPVIWKNGVRQNLNENTTLMAHVLGLDVSASGDVYACGHVTGKEAVLWKNGKMETIFPQGTLCNLFVSDNDLYVTGYGSDFSTEYLSGYVLKNGKELYCMPAEERSCTLSASYLYNSDLYTVGEIGNAKGHDTVKIWKNGVELMKLTDGTVVSEGNDIIVK